MKPLVGYLFLGLAFVTFAAVTIVVALGRFANRGPLRPLDRSDELSSADRAIEELRRDDAEWRRRR